MKSSMLKSFWACGDNQIIEYAMLRARLNKMERAVLELILDECMTQEEAAEILECSTRHVQEIWNAASNKLLRIPWVMAYAKELNNH